MIPIAIPSISKLEIEYVTKAVESGWVSSIGEYIQEFESEYAKFCGTEYALVTSSGTTALHLALEAYGIGRGDEVILPDLTFIATANAITYTGAKPIFVDVDEDNFCISPDSVQRAINSNTKAIIPVHLYGHPANMNELNKIALDHGIRVIEDAAEAHGAKAFGKSVGSLGDCGIFSFYGNKIITTGEGGAITTSDPEFYSRAVELRDHAMCKDKRYWHNMIGFNYRMTNMQAALGVAQLKRINEILHKKREIFSTYSKNLGSVNGVRLNKCAPWAENIYWMICLSIDGYTYAKRDKLMRSLYKEGIDTRPFFYPVSSMSMYSKTYGTNISDKVSNEGINLPSYYDITSDQIEYICNTLKKILSADNE